MKSELNRDIINLMSAGGADIVGFADLKGVWDNVLPYGVVIGIALAPHLFLSAKDLPNKEYYEEYNRVNEKLNALVIKGADYLKSKGYKADALTVLAVDANEHKRALIPVKTIATRAGIGFIGKNDLLVTKRYGSAVRISSFVTDAEFECGQPIEESQCGGCTMCRDNCPGEAIHGTLWKPSADRDKIVDVHKCAATARELCSQRIGIEHTICGKCIAICPYTQQYVR